MICLMMFDIQYHFLDRVSTAYLFPLFLMEAIEPSYFRPGIRGSMVCWQV